MLNQRSPFWHRCCREPIGSGADSLVLSLGRFAVERMCVLEPCLPDPEVALFWIDYFYLRLSLQPIVPVTTFMLGSEHNRQKNLCQPTLQKLKKIAVFLPRPARHDIPVAGGLFGFDDFSRESLNMNSQNSSPAYRSRNQQPKQPKK